MQTDWTFTDDDNWKGRSANNSERITDWSREET